MKSRLRSLSYFIVSLFKRIVPLTRRLVSGTLEEEGTEEPALRNPTFYFPAAEKRWNKRHPADSFSRKSLIGPGDMINTGSISWCETRYRNVVIRHQWRLLCVTGMQVSSCSVVVATSLMIVYQKSVIKTFLTEVQKYCDLIDFVRIAQL